MHSVADSGNQALLLIGRSRAQREETEEHQFGFGAERYFYAFIVALVLFTVGAVFSVYEGIHRIMHPAKLVSPVVALVVLGIAVVLESLSLRTAVKESNHSRGRASWRSFIRHAKAPELPAVLLEDVAALSGLLLALIGVSVATLTHDDVWDGAGSVAIGLLLATVAVVLATEMKSLLIGESASADVEAAIVAAIEAGPEVDRVIHLRTLHVGPETLLVAAKIGVLHDDTRGERRGGHRRRRAPDPRGSPDRRADLPGTRHLPGGPRRPGGSGGQSRQAALAARAGPAGTPRCTQAPGLARSVEQGGQLASVPDRRQVAIAARVRPHVGIERHRFRQGRRRLVEQPGACPGARQVVAGHAAGRGWRTEVGRGHDGVLGQRHGPIGPPVAQVVLAEMPSRMPETAHDDLQPQLPAAQPRIPGRLRQVLRG